VQVLKAKYVRAKELGGRANALKADIGGYKATLQRERLRVSAADIAAGGDGTPVDTGGAEGGARDESAAAAEARAKLDVAKGEYHAAFDELRVLKREIEHLQKLLEQSRDGMAVRVLRRLFCVETAINGLGCSSWQRHSMRMI
jgi:hypothetical protein